MNSFLCRVMTLVFLFNCLTPTTGWGQTSRRPKAKKSALETQVDAQVKKAQQANSPAARFARADQEARTAHNARFAQADSMAQENRQNLSRLNDERLVQRPHSLYVAPRVAQGRVPVETQVPAKTFLKKVTNNEISFEQLIDYADPMDPNPAANDLLTIAYAAEVISNTVGEAMQLDDSQYDVNEFQAQLVQIQARLLWRMALLGFEVPSYTANSTKDPVSVSRLALNGASSSHKTMALASLRMALLKIHQFYQAKHLPDPADEYQKEKLVKQALNAKKPLTRANPRVHDGLVSVPTNATRQPAPQAGARTQAAQMVKNHGNLAVFMNQFVNEFKQAIAQEPEQGTADYQHVQIRAEYATAYALEYDPSVLKKIVAVVDQGPKETDFKQDYSPILNAIFVTVFENTRYSTMGEAKTKQVLNLLQEFSDPQKYSLPTRVFALEAASLLYRPFNQDSFNLKQQSPAFAFFAPMNLNKPDENLRRVFAARVAELYCPLVSTNSYVMKDYGLSSDEMAALADKLGYMYDGFYDIQTQWVEATDAPASTRVRANYPRTSCNITTHGNLNALKKQNERTAAFLYFTAEVLFWVYGGEVFALLGTAFRLTRGAVVALPKAGKALRLAPNGQRIAAFNAEVSQGAKYANWVYKNKNQQGYFVELLVEKEPGAVPGVKAARTTQVGPVRQAPAPVVEAKRVSHTYQLQGQYSHWNPKRWVGMKPAQNVVGMRVTRMEPGFNITVAEARFDAPVSGLRSMQDIEKAWGQLRLVNDPATAMAYETKPYWRAILDLRQAQQEQLLLGGLGSSLKNQVDLWVPMGNAAQTGGKISEATKWWNMSQWGRPQMAADVLSGKMPLFVAPKTSLGSGRLAGQMMNPEGIANISEVLPGFYTTGVDLATGNVQRQMFNAYFKPMNWQNNITKTFLPDYVPTRMFWKSVQKNPVLGAQLAPQLLWRNRFAFTTAFFGAWMGADRVLYPPFKGWMEGQATKDANEEIAKYGDTFSPQEAKMDELLLQEMGVDLSDKRAMNTYNDVLAAQPDQPDGTLIAAPIVGARRVMGMSFIGDDVKTDYAHQAQRTDLNRALLRRNYSRFQTNQQATAQWKKEQRQTIEQDEQKILAMYAQGFAQLPRVKKELHAAYETYAKEFLAAQTQEQATQASERFNKNVEGLISQAAEWDSALKTAESLITQAKALYAAEPGLITRHVENYIRQALRTYAAQRCAALQAANPQAAADQAAQTLEETLNPLWIGLSVQYRALHPEEQPAQPQENVGYGVDFDPNAADK